MDEAPPDEAVGALNFVGKDKRKKREMLSGVGATSKPVDRSDAASTMKSFQALNGEISQT